MQVEKQTIPLQAKDMSGEGQPLQEEGQESLEEGQIHLAVQTTPLPTRERLGEGLGGR